MPDLDAARQTVAVARGVIDAASLHVAETVGTGGDPSRMPRNQTVVYDLAHAAAAVEIAESSIAYGDKGELEARIACAFVADAVHDLATRLFGRDGVWGVTADALVGTLAFRQRVPFARVPRGVGRPTRPSPSRR